MAGNSIEINSNVNDINIQPDFNKITVVNPDGCFVTITQPVTNVIQVATPGPAGPAGPTGPAGPSGSFETGSFVTTSSFNSYTGSSNSQFSGTSSFASTASYVYEAQNNFDTISYNNTTFGITAFRTNGGQQTAFITNVPSSSYANTSSIADNATNANTATNANNVYVNAASTTTINVIPTYQADGGTDGYKSLQLSSNPLSYYYRTTNRQSGVSQQADELHIGGGANTAGGIFLNSTIGIPSYVSTDGPLHLFSQGYKVQISSSANDVEIIGLTRITGSVDVKSGNINIDSNSYFFQGTSTGGSNVSLIGVNSQDEIYIGNQGYTNIIADDTNIEGDTQITGSLTVSGSSTFTNIGPAIFSGSVDITGSLNLDGPFTITGSIESPTSITFDTTATDADAIARLKWNETEGTLDLGMGGGLATLQMGQELYYPKIVNKSGEDLINGTLVMVDPAQPAQGNRLRVIRAVTDGTYPSELIVGPLTEDVNNNQEGFATWFGYVRNLNRTDLENNGIKDPTDTWVEGSILYTNPNLDGGYTSSMQPAPASKSSIAAVTAVNGQNITLLVRPKLDTNVGSLHDVTDLTTTSSYGDLFIKSGNIWTTGKSLSGSYSLTGNLTSSGNISSSGIVYGTTGSFSYLQGNSPITVGDSITFQQSITASGNISASGTITATSASFTHISGTISNIIWTVDFTDGELNTILYAPYNLSIDSVTNVYNSPTSSISSSGSPYTLGNAITTGEPIDITVSTGSVINLNITR